MLQSTGLPVLMYGIETWVSRNKYKYKIQCAENKCSRSVIGCTRIDR